MFDGLSSRALRLGVVAAAATAMVASFGSPADAAPKKAKAGNDHRSVGANYNHGKALRFSAKESDSGGGAQEGGAVVGTVRQWPALDDENGVVYTKRYRLRGVGDHIEVWVAENLAYPAGDCRNTRGLTDITDAQVEGFIDEFDCNIYPKESRSFSGAPGPGRLQAQLGRTGRSTRPARPTTSRAGRQRPGRELLRAVDPDGQTYIAGFFYSVFNELPRPQRDDDRRVRLAAPHRRHTAGRQRRPRYAACAAQTGRPSALAPHHYEGTFAHEYQHLLESYEDPGEASWVNEGLSDYAQRLVGLRRHRSSTVRPDSRRPHHVLPGYRRAAVRRSGELADPVGGPGRPRDPGRLRRCVLVHEYLWTTTAKPSCGPAH